MTRSITGSGPRRAERFTTTAAIGLFALGATACSGSTTAGADIEVPPPVAIDATPPTASATARRPRAPRTNTDVPPPPSHTPSDADRARAEALFTDGRAGMAKGDYAAACEAFRASDALDPAIGTEFNLGVCLRKLGKLDEACEAFDQAHAKAIVKGQDDRVKLLEEAMTSVPCTH